MKQRACSVVVALGFWTAGVGLSGTAQEPATVAGPTARVLSQPQRARLTIFQDDTAQVSEEFVFGQPLQPGTWELRYTDAPAGLEATTLRLTLDDPRARVLEVNVELPAASLQELVRRWTGKRIVLHTRQGQKYEGILQGVDRDFFILSAPQAGGPQTLVRRGEHIVRLELPDAPHAAAGQADRTVVSWLVHTTQPVHSLTCAYLTRGLKWRCDYQVTLSGDEKSARWAAWFALENRSGRTWSGAQVQLAAASPLQTQAEQPMPLGHEYLRLVTSERTADGTASGKFPSLGAAPSLFPLTGTATLKNNSLTHMEAVRLELTNVEKMYLYDGAQVAWLPSGRYDQPQFGTANMRRHPQIVLRARLPATDRWPVFPPGKCRIFQADTEGKLQFLGEDWLPKTLAGEQVLLAVGDAFDILAHRAQTDFQRNGPTLEEGIAISVRNHRQRPVRVYVLEKFYRSPEWKLIGHTHDYEKVGSRAVVFPVDVPAQGTAQVSYRVQYR